MIIVSDTSVFLHVGQTPAFSVLTFPDEVYLVLIVLPIGSGQVNFTDRVHLG